MTTAMKLLWLWMECGYLFASQPPSTHGTHTGSWAAHGAHTNGHIPGRVLHIACMPQDCAWRTYTRRIYPVVDRTWHAAGLTLEECSDCVALRHRKFYDPFKSWLLTVHARLLSRAMATTGLTHVGEAVSSPSIAQAMCVYLLQHLCAYVHSNKGLHACIHTHVQSHKKINI